MVRLTSSTLLAFMLVAPCIALPVIPHKAEVHTEDLTARDPSFMSLYRKARKIVTPQNINTVRNVVSSLSKRELPESADELAARDPSFMSLYRKARRIVTPQNINTVRNVVSSLSKRELAESADELAARDPSFMSLYRKARKIVTPQNINTVRNVVSSLSKRSLGDGEDLSERDIEDIQLVIREFDELVSREPSFGSLWRKIKHAVTIKNIRTAVDMAKTLKGRELSPELEELAAREPLVDAVLKTVKELTAPEATEAASPAAAHIIAREDNPEMYDRDLEDLNTREPSLGSLWRKAKPLATRKNVKDVSDLVRSFARELSLDELD